METLTKKTLVLKKTEPEPSAAETVDEAANPPQASVFAAQASASASTGGSYTFDAICALVAVLLLGGLLAVQWMEDSYYTNAIPTGSLAAAPTAPAQ